MIVNQIITLEVHALMSYDVFGVGNALVDVQAQITDEALSKLEFAKGIMTLVDEETQGRVLGAIAGTPISECAGGSAANTIMGIADFGGRVAYAGKVSTDSMGFDSTLHLPSGLRRSGEALMCVGYEE